MTEQTDRELLEKAARAAGDPVEAWAADADAVPVALLESGVFWQPLLRNLLTDCMGDALRLATKLGMLDDSTHAHIELMWQLSSVKDADPYAATRRAIVRAAASMAGAA